MGDGGCAVLSSHNSLDKFRSFHKLRGLSKRNYARDRLAKLPENSLSEISQAQVSCRKIAELRERDFGRSTKPADGDAKRRRLSSRLDSARELSFENERRIAVDRPAFLPGRFKHSDDFGWIQSRRASRDEGESITLHIGRQSGLGSSTAHAEDNEQFRYGTSRDAIQRDCRISIQKHSTAKYPRLDSNKQRTSKRKKRVSDTCTFSGSGWRESTENAGRNYHGGSSDSKYEKNDAAYFYSEKLSCRSKHYHVRDKLHDTSASFRHVQKASHRGSSHSHRGSNIYGKANDMSDSGRNYERTPRDYAGRSHLGFDLSDKRDNLRSRSVCSSERTYADAGKNVCKWRKCTTDDFVAFEEHAEDKLNWESHREMFNCFQGFSRSQSFGSRNYIEELRLVRKGTADDDAFIGDPDAMYRGKYGRNLMKVSPQPLTADDISERSSKACWKMQNNSNEHELAKHAKNSQEPEETGSFYLDCEGITRAFIQIDLMKQFGMQHSEQMVVLDGGDKWLHLQQALPPVSTSSFGISQAVSEKSVLASIQDCSPWCPSAETAVSVSWLSSSCGTEGDHTVATLDQTSVVEDLQIDERVEHLMEGFTLVPGKEKEAVSEALSFASRHIEWEKEIFLDNKDSPWPDTGIAAHWKDDHGISETNLAADLQESREPAACRSSATDAGDRGFLNNFQSTLRWTTRGGDWKRIRKPESTLTVRGAYASAGIERVARLKWVLNDGSPVCELRDSTLADPRMEAAQSSKRVVPEARKLNLPPWAYQSHEGKAEISRKLERPIENRLKSDQQQIAMHKMHILRSISQSSKAVSHLLAPQGTAAGTELKKRSTRVMRARRSTCQAMERVSSKPFLQNLSASKHDSACASGEMLDVHGAISNFSDNGYANHTDLALVEEMRCTDSARLHQVLDDCALEQNQPPVLSVNGAFPLEKSMKQLAKEDKDIHDGEWCYKDGAGNEVGSFTCTQLQLMVKQGSTYGATSVCKQSDELSSCQMDIQPATEERNYQPMYHRKESLMPIPMPLEHNLTPVAHNAGYPLCVFENQNDHSRSRLLLLGPQDIGISEGNQNQQRKERSEMPFLNGIASVHHLCARSLEYIHAKLHEHVIRSYKSRDFAAALHEGLEKKSNENQITASQSPLLKTMLVHSSPLSIGSTGFSSLGGTLRILPTPSIKSHSGHPRVLRARRRRCLIGAETNCVVGSNRSLQESLASDKECGENQDTPFVDFNLQTENKACESSAEPKMPSDWITLDSYLLMRVFHFLLRDDIKSLVFASMTCKSWRISFKNFSLRQGMEITEAIKASCKGFAVDSSKHSANMDLEC